MVSEKRKAGVRRMIKHPLKIDMTPMVDLGFLLITFFVITTELAKPVVMDLNMPKEGPPMLLGSSNALTVLLDDNKIYYYQGEGEDAFKKGEIHQTNFSGTHDFRKIITDKQLKLDSQVPTRDKEGRDGLMLVIKPATTASYEAVVNTLDEVLINRIKKYAIVKLSPAEDLWLKQKDKG